MTFLIISRSIRFFINICFIKLNHGCFIFLGQMFSNHFSLVTSFGRILRLLRCRVRVSLRCRISRRCRVSRRWRVSRRCRVSCFICKFLHGTLVNSYLITRSISISRSWIFSRLAVRVFLLSELIPLGINFLSILIKLFPFFSNLDHLPNKIVVFIFIHTTSNLILLGSLILFSFVLSLVLLLWWLLLRLVGLLLLENSEGNQVPGIPQNITNKLLVRIYLKEWFVRRLDKWWIIAWIWE